MGPQGTLSPTMAAESQSHCLVAVADHWPSAGAVEVARGPAAASVVQAARVGWVVGRAEGANSLQAGQAGWVAAVTAVAEAAARARVAAAQVAAAEAAKRAQVGCNRRLGRAGWAAAGAAASEAAAWATVAAARARAARVVEC